MVNLNGEQQRLIENLAHAKRVYDTKVEDLEATLRRLRSELKEPLREMVRAAKDLGIPERQIHVYGLGMAQRQQMYTFLMTPADKAGLDEAYRAVLYSTPTELATEVGRFATNTAAVAWTFTSLDAAGKMWEAVDPEGNRYGINILSAGKIAMMKPNKDKPGEYSEWTPELIRQAKIHNPKWITQEEYKAIAAQQEDDNEEDE